MITEQKKYEKCWKDERYRKYSPGEEMLPLFKQMVRPVQDARSTLLDIGAGTGRASLALANMGWDVTCMDFAPNALEVDLPFIKQNIYGRWRHANLKEWGTHNMEVFDQGYCCDVMEHLPPDRVAKALKNISEHTKRCFFSIHFGPDHFGKVVGHPLHLTVQPYEWWMATLAQFGTVRQGRDLLGMGAFDVRF